MWMVLCGVLVVFMQPGAMLLEAGSARSKSIQGVMARHMTHACVIAMTWLVVGWAFAFSGPFKTVDGREFKTRLVGVREFAATDFYAEPAGGLVEPSDKMARWFFHWAVACVAASQVSGGLTERVSYCSYTFIIVLFSVVIYPIAVASVWGKGWLTEVNEVGAFDFAGGVIVHISGGTVGLAAALVSGPRPHRWENPERFAPHSPTLIVLGTLAQWFGWYGLSCGMTGGMGEAAGAFTAAQVAMNNTLAAAAGGLVAFVVSFLSSRCTQYDVQKFCHGILAGLVAISPGCATVTVWASLLIGVVGGLVYLAISKLARRGKVDDPIDAFAVHAVPGCWGALAAVVFDWHMDASKFHGPGGWACVPSADGCNPDALAHALWANFLMISFVLFWALIISVVLLLPLRMLRLFRYDGPMEEPPAAEVAGDMVLLGGHRVPGLVAI